MLLTKKPSKLLKTSYVRSDVCLLHAGANLAHAGCYQNLKIPTIVMACKSDLTKKVHPGVATKILERYHSGLIELTCVDDVGKEKVRRTFEFLIKTIIKQRRELRCRLCQP